jgi:hypothetical protein
LISSHRWKLNFNLRTNEVAADVQDSEVFDDDIVNEARGVISQNFNAAVEKGLKGNSPVTGIVKKIAAVTGRPKQKWPLSFLRSLFDELLLNSDNRNKTEEYENRWLNLPGYALRPGIGHSFDDSRVKELWKLFRAGIVFDKNPQVRNEWWILWRRVAAGLNPGQQRQFFQELSPIIFSGKKNKVSPQEKIEIWMALANMERLIVKDKIKCGDQLLSEFSGKKTPAQYLWAMSRFGGREPLYGSVDRVVPPSTAKKWIQFIMEIRFEGDRKNPAHALINMARKTGDISRDLDEPFIKEILDWIHRHKIHHISTKPLTEVIPFSVKEENSIYGEALPAGIVMH